MKTYTLLFTAIALFMGISGKAQQISNAELQVTGLTCSMCSKATETALKSLDFVNTISTDLNQNLFTIQFKKDRKVNIDLIRKKVEDAGFSIGKLSATFNFNATPVDQSGRATVDGNVYQLTNSDKKALNGAVKATVIDKNFVSNGAYKSNLKSVKADSYASGTALINGRKTRVYHLSI
ncbi:MAG: heavy-metal-associated domain-containing protein [Pedobacter sp.]|nr:MAG: heavy-metal-associated domain-containing protein [Pedobacter sp.]